LIISVIGDMSYPDMSAETADLLLRLQDIKCVICLGLYKSSLILSVRSRSRKIGAGKLVQKIVGDLGTAGGHGTMAAGHIPLRNIDPFQLVQEIKRKALVIIKDSGSKKGKSII
jgi:nanoRNase/pAp phosphatase (c-di-AMP/oligoRNAs hydrolase)